MSLWIKGVLMVCGGVVGAQLGIELQNKLSESYRAKLAQQIEQQIAAEQSQQQSNTLQHQSRDQGDLEFKSDDQWQETKSN